MVVSTNQILIFLPAALLVAASPGANNLLALRNAVRCGLRPAPRASGGEPDS